jgi:alkylation response protein AidB-like acyl-CoA dehydrogenase
MAYQAPVQEHLFLLSEVLGIANYANLKGFSDASEDLVGQVLEESARFCQEVLEPLNKVGDREGCTLDPATGEVTTPTGFKAAYKQLVEAGWPALSVDPDHGGQGLPFLLNLCFSEMASSANMAFSMYPGLTHGAFSAILNGGSAEQKAHYLPKLGSGEWSGAMNLTEPQCGTDLGMVRTRAVPNDDGSYAITGEKIWISGGEHDLAPNIVELILARTEGAPRGSKGLSLFVTSKFLEDGTRNSYRCVGLEEKMGIHGNSTCVMAYDGARAWMVGEEHKGLRLMFVMMNEARLGVAVQGLSQAEAAYQAAVAFARDRLQGRSLTGAKNPEGPADPIIVHPDVRRMLMDSKAVIEGGRALLFWTFLQLDLEHRAEDEATRQKASDRLALMTPVVKAYLSDRGFKIASDCLQVHGGSGFTKHFPAEQYLRDARIAMIYEGTNGVQALDLVGRKLAADGGRAIRDFIADCDAYAAEIEGTEGLQPFAAGLRSAKGVLQDATLWLVQNGLANPDNAGAASTDYLEILATTGLALMWAQMARAAVTDPASAFHQAKLKTGRYFLDRILPEAAMHLAKLKTGAEPVMALTADEF